MQILVVDIGGSHVKARLSGHRKTVRFESGPQLTPRTMMGRLRRATAGWRYDAVSIGFPGPVTHGKPAAEPQNLGDGWVRFNFKRAFGKPIKLINDAAMQALGSYHGGRMLFLGLGTGVGSTLILDDVVIPLELGELRYSTSKTLRAVLRQRRETRAPARGRRTRFKPAGFLRRFATLAGTLQPSSDQETHADHRLSREQNTGEQMPWVCAGGHPPDRWRGEDRPARPPAPLGLLSIPRPGCRRWEAP
jgi:hypothetical protein